MRLLSTPMVDTETVFLVFQAVHVPEKSFADVVGGLKTVVGCATSFLEPNKNGDVVSVQLNEAAYQNI